MDGRGRSCVNHDPQCERGPRLFRPGPRQTHEPRVHTNTRCHCHKRQRETAGIYTPPGLTHGYCDGCRRMPERNYYCDDDALWICHRCQVEWDSRGYACWRDDHGYLGEPVTTPQLSGERL